MSKHRYSGRVKQDSGTGKWARIKLGFCADRADLLLAVKQVLKSSGQCDCTWWKRST